MPNVLDTKYDEHKKQNKTDHTTKTNKTETNESLLLSLRMVCSRKDETSLFGHVKRQGLF